MRLLGWLRSALFSKNGKGPGLKKTLQPEGILVFSGTGEVIRAEKLLVEHGYAVRVMGPPPALRTGCDMVIVFPLLHGLAITRILESSGIPPLRMTTADKELLDPVSLYQVKDFGDYLMVRAANMKITARKADRRIVNVSGGGCPDVPYLAALLTGKTLDDSALLAKHGETLCGYALCLAFAELEKILPRESRHGAN